MERVCQYSASYNKTRMFGDRRNMVVMEMMKKEDELSIPIFPARGGLGEP